MEEIITVMSSDEETEEQAISVVAVGLHSLEGGDARFTASNMEQLAPPNAPGEAAGAAAAATAAFAPGAVLGVAAAAPILTGDPSSVSSGDKTATNAEPVTNEETEEQAMEDEETEEQAMGVVGVSLHSLKGEDAQFNGLQGTVEAWPSKAQFVVSVTLHSTGHKIGVAASNMELSGTTDGTTGALVPPNAPGAAVGTAAAYTPGAVVGVAAAAPNLTGDPSSVSSGDKTTNAEPVTNEEGGCQGSGEEDGGVPNEDSREMADIEPGVDFEGFTPLARCRSVENEGRSGAVVAYSATVRNTCAVLFSEAKVGDFLELMSLSDVSRLEPRQCGRQISTQGEVISSAKDASLTAAGLSAFPAKSSLSFSLQFMSGNGVDSFDDQSAQIRVEHRCTLFLVKEVQEEVSCSAALSSSSSSSSSKSQQEKNPPAAMVVVERWETCCQQTSSVVFDNVVLNFVPGLYLLAVVFSDDVSSSSSPSPSSSSSRLDLSRIRINGCTYPLLVYGDENEAELSLHSEESSQEDLEGGLTQEEDLDLSLQQENLEELELRLSQEENIEPTSNFDGEEEYHSSSSLSSEALATEGNYEQPKKKPKRAPADMDHTHLDRHLEESGTTPPENIISLARKVIQILRDPAILSTSLIDQVLPPAIQVAKALRSCEVMMSRDNDDSSVATQKETALMADVRSDVQRREESELLELANMLEVRGQMDARDIAVSRQSTLEGKTPPVYPSKERHSWALSCAHRRAANELRSTWTAIAKRELNEENFPDTSCDLCASCGRGNGASPPSQEDDEYRDEEGGHHLNMCDTCSAGFHPKCAERCAGALEWNLNLATSNGASITHMYVNPSDTAESELWSCPLCHASWHLHQAAASGDTAKLYTISATALGNPFDTVSRLACKDSGVVEAALSETALHAAAARNDTVALSMLLPPLLIPEYRAETPLVSPLKLTASSSSPPAEVNSLPLDEQKVCLPPGWLFLSLDGARRCPIAVAQSSVGRTGAHHTEAELFLSRRFDLTSSLSSGDPDDGIARSKVAAPPRPLGSITASQSEDSCFQTHADVSQGREWYPVFWSNEVNDAQLPMFDYVGWPVEGRGVGVEWGAFDGFFSAASSCSGKGRGGGSNAETKPACFRGCSDCIEATGLSGCSKRLLVTSSSSGGASCECGIFCQCWRNFATTNARFGGGGPLSVPRGLCSFQASQNPMPFKVSIFMTPGGLRGWGLRAEEDIAADEFVGCYAGEILSAQEARKREEQYGRDGHHSSYMLNLGIDKGGGRAQLSSSSSSSSVSSTCQAGKRQHSDRVVDAQVVRNAMAFVNHSNAMEANLRLKYVLPGHRDASLGRTVFVSKRRIKSGEELTFTYGKDSELRFG